MRRASSSGETASPVGSRGGTSSVSATPWGPEGPASPRYSSSSISALVTSSSSWQASSSWWASSSCILQSSKMFSYLIMDLSIAVREVCRELSLCSSSLPDAASATTCMASDVASNSVCIWIHRLLHFHREEATLVRLFSMCLRFSLMTWVTTSSNCSPPVVPGLRK